jgi:hypothetical protein
MTVARDAFPRVVVFVVEVANALTTLPLGGDALLAFRGNEANAEAGLDPVKK